MGSHTRFSGDPALEDRIRALRADAVSAVEEIFELAFARPASERLAIATALMQQVADDLGAVESLVARPRSSGVLRVLEGGRFPAAAQVKKRKA